MGRSNSDDEEKEGGSHIMYNNWMDAQMGIVSSTYDPNAEAPDGIEIPDFDPREDDEHPMGTGD